MDAYTEAHLFVAAVRVLEFQKQSTPSVEDICTMLGFSIENGHRLCRKYQREGIVKVVEDPYSQKVAVADHLAIEQLPKSTAEESSIEQEVKKFQEAKRQSDKKVADIQEELEQKKKDMLSDIEAKFKKEMEKFKKE